MSLRATVAVEAHADGLAEALALLRDYAEAGAAEPGVLCLRVARDILAPSRFVICEEWETQAALDAHMTQSHTQALLAAFGNPEVIAGTEIWQSFEAEPSEATA